VEYNLKSILFSHFWVSCNCLLCTFHVKCEFEANPIKFCQLRVQALILYMTAE